MKGRRHKAPSYYAMANTKQNKRATDDYHSAVNGGVSHEKLQQRHDFQRKEL